MGQQLSIVFPEVAPQIVADKAGYLAVVQIPREAGFRFAVFRAR